MSSPYHSLKKNKVPLFPGHMTGNRPIPFRHPEYSEDESKLLEEITSSMVQDKKKQYLPHLSVSTSQTLVRLPETSRTDSSPERRVDSKAPPNDHELMRLMMNKITLLEQKVQSQEKDIKNKDRQIKILEDKLRITEKARKESTSTSEVKDLETHCLLLQQQVHEMETFLAEYGMVWVGESSDANSNVYLPDSIDDDDDENNNVTEVSIRSDSPDNSIASSNPFGIWRQDVSLPVAPTPLNIDFNLLIENIKDLNVLAGEGVAQIKKTADGARFEVPESVQLTLYANGIMMFDGPFRPYTDPKTRQCVKDLLDGYFPTELQKRYPDGVPFMVNDLRGTNFQPKQSQSIFAGMGQTLGGDIKPSRLVRTNLRDSTKMIQMPSPRTPVPSSSTSDQLKESLPTTSKLPGKIMPQDQFLNKLPKSVIKDGKVIDIRESIGKTLTGNDSGKSSSPTSTITVIKTSATKEASESFSNNSSERPRSVKSQGDITTLRVVTENGDHTYIIKMKFKETVGDLRRYLDGQRRPKLPYDIVSTFPNKVHKNNTLTLEASGLTPNAVLHLKPHKD